MSLSLLARATRAAGGTEALIRERGEKWVREALRRWSAVARPEQLAPPGNWDTWLILAGRGFGKTRCGAETVVDWAQSGLCRRLALVAPTSADGRDVMVEGESGILACSARARFRATYEPSKRRLTWSNGAIATLFSAEEPDRMRGPQFDGAWADELAAWDDPQAAWDQLQFACRLGKHPRIVVTTTPRPLPIIRALIRDEHTVVTRGATYDNSANLAASFLAALRRAYEGTRLGRQEINAEVLEDNPNALWNQAVIDVLRVQAAPLELQRVAVSVDPAVTANADSDLTGIVAGGRVESCHLQPGCKGETHALVFEDASGIYTPAEWARVSTGIYHARSADRLIGEVNNGGDLVEANVRAAGIDAANISYRAVHASRGKVVRAEPVAALYEQCVAGGSMVATEKGEIPIESIRAGDYVWTRSGLRRVRWSGATGTRKTIAIATVDGHRLNLTPDHPTHVAGRGFVSAGQLAPRTFSLTTCSPAAIAALRLRGARDVVPARLSTAGRPHEIRNAHTSLSLAFDTFCREMGTGGAGDPLAANFFIAPSGGSYAVRSRPAGMFTMSTETEPTTLSQTSSRWLSGSMEALRMRIEEVGLTPPAGGWPKSEWPGGVGDSRSSVSAMSAARTSPQRPPAFDSALQPVTRASGIARSDDGPTVRVYDLSVDAEEEEGEFFANGILVHNCKVHHVGTHGKLEDEMTQWDPLAGLKSPSRMDALVWLLTDLMLGEGPAKYQRPPAPPPRRAYAGRS